MARWQLTWSDLEKSIPWLIAVCFAIGLLLYAFLEIPSGLGHTKLDYYPQYARALLRGRLWLAQAPRWEKCPHDLSFAGGKCYLYWGIFPALVHILLPVSDRLLAIGGAVLALFFLNRIILRVASRFSDTETGNLALVFPLCLAFSFLSGMGLMGLVGRIYEESLAIATGTGLMGIYFSLPVLLGEKTQLERRDLWLSILGLTAAALTRNPWFLVGAITGVIHLIKILRATTQKERFEALNRVAGPALLFVGAICFQLLLNFLRYGKFLDPGLLCQTTQLLMHEWLKTHPGIYSIWYYPYNILVYWFTGYYAIFTEEIVLLDWARTHCFYSEYPGGLLVWMPGILGAFAVSYKKLPRESLFFLVVVFLPLAITPLSMGAQIYRYLWETTAFFAVPMVSVLLSRSSGLSWKHVAYQWAALGVTILMTFIQWQAILRLQTNSL